jgi:hypothetical protein
MSVIFEGVLKIFDLIKVLIFITYEITNWIKKLIIFLLDIYDFIGKKNLN